MKITIGGDFCITPEYLSNNLFAPQISELFKNSDFNIVNLECPVTEAITSNKIVKTGPHLRTDEMIFQHLKQLHIDAVTLANNHMLDYGEAGLLETIKNCIDNKILYVGAGRNHKEAAEPLRIDHEGITVSFINFCENEWSTATNDQGGTNSIDIIDNLNQIKKANKDTDFVIVIIHGGHEYYQLPSPRMIKQYRFYAENGADAVICHHTHCISGYEVHQNVPILYSLGNMIFTHTSKNELWYTGLVAQLILEKGQPIHFDLIPVRQLPDIFKLTKLENSKANEVLEDLDYLCRVIDNPNELLKKWNVFVQSKQNTINVFSPLNIIPGRYFQSAFRRLKLNRFFIRRRNLKRILNHIRCESHRDVIIEILKKKLLF